MAQQLRSAQVTVDRLQNELAGASSSRSDLGAQLAQAQALVAQLRSDSAVANQQAQAAIADLRAKIVDESAARRAAEIAKSQAEAAAVSASERAKTAEAAAVSANERARTAEAAQAQVSAQVAAKAAGKGGWLNIYTQGPATERKRAAS